METRKSYHLVKIFRMKCGLEKNQLANLAGITPRILHIIEENPNYNTSRKTMVKISNVLGVPPSVLFFPKEEIEKRQMLSNLVTICLENSSLSEKDIWINFHKSSVNTHRSDPDSDSPDEKEHKTSDQ